MMSHTVGMCVTRDAVAIARRAARSALYISASRCLQDDGLTGSLGALRQELGPISKCHVAIGPSLAQVRRIHTLSPEPEADLLLRLISENVSYFFVGAPGSLTVMSAARADDGALWAWAVETDWYESFTLAMTASGLHLESCAPSTRVLLPGATVSLEEFRVRDADAESVIAIRGGVADEEWREPAAHAELLDLPDCAHKALIGQGSCFLASPSQRQRETLNAYRRIRIAACVTLVAASVALCKPMVTHEAFMHHLAAEQAALQIGHRAVLPVLELEQRVSLLGVAETQLTRATSPVIETLAAVAGALGDESVLTSFRVDSASVDLTVTTPSTSELLDSLGRSGRFGDVRLVGSITRTSSSQSTPSLTAGGAEPSREDRVTIHMQLLSGAHRLPERVEPRRMADRDARVGAVSSYGSNQ